MIRRSATQSEHVLNTCVLFGFNIAKRLRAMCFCGGNMRIQCVALFWWSQGRWREHDGTVEQAYTLMTIRCALNVECFRGYT